MRRALAALAVALVAGCSLPLPDGVRTPSDVTGQDGRAGLQVLPEGPSLSQGARGAVAGFIAAQASPLGDYAIARQYLVGQAALRWSPESGIRVFRPDLETVSSDRQDPSIIRVTMSTVATGASTGHYTPVRGTPSETYGVTKDRSGGWRISSLPDGVGLQLSQTDLARTFAVRNLYYLAPQRHTTDLRHLVPDRVFLPAAPDLSELLVRRVLGTPYEGLSGSVAPTGVPGLKVLDVSRSRDGVVTVALSNQVRALSGEALRDLAAQLVWTLRQESQVTGLRLREDGLPVRVDGEPDVIPVTEFASYDPDGLPANPPYYFLADGHLRSSVKGLARSELTVGPRRLEAIAISPRDDRVAALHRVGDRVEVLLGSTRSGSVTTPDRAVGLSSPTWGSGEVGLWMLQGDDRVVRLDPLGGRLSRVPLSQPLTGITSLAVSRDGARVALAVGRTVRVGRIVWGPAGARVVDLRPLATSVTVQQQVASNAIVQQVAWATSTDLVVLLRGSGAARVVQRLTVDGSGPLPAQPLPLAVSPTAITAAGASVLVSSGGRSQVFGVGQSAALQQAGSSPVYPG